MLCRRIAMEHGFSGPESCGAEPNAQRVIVVNAPIIDEAPQRDLLTPFKPAFGIFSDKNNDLRDTIGALGIYNNRYSSIQSPPRSGT